MDNQILIEQFVSNYAANFSAYEKVAQEMKTCLTDLLREKGVMAIVTTRAKDPERLMDKIQRTQRAEGFEGKPPYSTDAELWDAVHDLIGARVALYFPADMKLVDEVLRSHFTMVRPVKVFPYKVKDYDQLVQTGFSAYKRRVYKGYEDRRFDGYRAHHFHVQFPVSPITGLRNPVIEVQVASVLMHAWSEVEHDLAYKTLMGTPSADEYACLDELNGLVIAGEMVLNRLNQLSRQRIINQTTPFESHFAMGIYLQNWLAKQFNMDKSALLADQGDSDAVGNVSRLFKMYQAKNMHTPEMLDKELKKLEANPPDTLAKLIDNLIDDFTQKNKTAAKTVVTTDVRKQNLSRKSDAHVGGFLGRWNRVDGLVQKAARARGYVCSTPAKTWQYVVDENVLTAEIAQLYRSLRVERNKIVHSTHVPGEQKFRKLDEDMRRLAELLKQEYGVE